MQYTPNYNLTIAEGADAVNPLTQIFPNFSTIDTAMEDNKEHGVTTASEVTTGGVHAIVRVDPNVPVFRFTATSAWTTGDTMTLDGSAVTVHLADGTAPKSGAYVIGAEVLAIVNGSLVTLMTGASFDGVVSFNSRQGVVTPQSGDYTANQIGYNNTVSGLTATDVQSAIDEIAAGGGGGSYTLLWTNPDTTASFANQNVQLSSSDYDLLMIEYQYSTTVTGTKSVIYTKGRQGLVEYSTNVNNTTHAFVQRYVDYVSDTEVTIQGAVMQTITANTLTQSFNNDYLIPVHIYGIKM